MNGEEDELRIPSVQQDVDIVGILHRKPRMDSSSPRRIALVLHGLLAHKNQCYHRALAQALTIDSYRFDFRGNGDTGGDWTMGNLDNDVRDLATVVRHLHHELGYVVELIVGHSRGSMISWLYLSKEERELQEDGGRGWVPRLVVVSGRWVMANVLKTYARFLEGFQKEGFYKWQITSAGKKREYIVWPNDLDRLTTSKDPKQVVACLSPKTDVLILHGTADRTVPVQDAHSYLAALSADPRRRPDSQRLHLIQGADHMYRGCTQPVVEQICKWFQERQAESSNGLAATSTSRL